MIDTTVYRDAFARIQAEYIEMPGMRLTSPQVQRLTGFSDEICALVLNALVSAQFLSVGLDGRYSRATEGAWPRPHPAKVDNVRLPQAFAARRAS